MATREELLLKKLRKLEENSRCVNCHAAAPRGIGFGNVCVKFGTFVCDMCKTSHQAVSHRVKSASMSTWTLEEVQALEYPAGGNAAASMRWLRSAPAPGQSYGRGRRPKAGDDIAVFKQFVVDCYERGLFRSDEPLLARTPARTPVEGASRGSPSPGTRAPVTTTILATSAEVSLLDLPAETSLAIGPHNSSRNTFLSSTAWGDFSGIPFERSRGRDTDAAAFLASNGAPGFQGTGCDDSPSDLFGEFTSASAAFPSDDVFSEFVARSAQPSAGELANTCKIDARPPIDLDALYNLHSSVVPGSSGVLALGEQISSPMRSNSSAISSMHPDSGVAFNLNPSLSFSRGIPASVFSLEAPLGLQTRALNTPRDHSKYTANNSVEPPYQDHRIPQFDSMRKASNG